MRGAVAQLEEDGEFVDGEFGVMFSGVGGSSGTSVLVEASRHCSGSLRCSHISED